jgi:hypothetical protein
LLAIFDALEEAVRSPGYNGCAFANATAEAAPDSVEAVALRNTRGWLHELILSLISEASFANPVAVAERLLLLYDGAVANSRLDTNPDAARVAKELAELVLETAPRSQAAQRRRAPDEASLEDSPAAQLRATSHL